MLLLGTVDGSTELDVGRTTLVLDVDNPMMDVEAESEDGDTTTVVLSASTEEPDTELAGGGSAVVRWCQRLTGPDSRRY
jgi:hypothetical protein